MARFLSVLDAIIAERRAFWGEILAMPENYHGRVPCGVYAHSQGNHMNAHGIRCVGVATGYRLNHSTREELFIDDLIRSGELAERLILAYAKL